MRACSRRACGRVFEKTRGKRVPQRPQGRVGRTGRSPAARWFPDHLGRTGAAAPGTQ